MDVFRGSVAATAVVIAALAAACGAADDPVVETQPGSTATSAQSASTTSTPGLVGASAEPVSEPGSASAVALLADVRAADHGAFDRVVFEFENEVPGYKVAYVERPVTEDGSGDEVEVDGEAVLEMRMDPASGADLSGSELRVTYNGPRRLSPGTEVVAELVRTGDFEGVLTWVAGVDGRRPFKVTTLTGPARLVVDIAHEG